MKETNKPFLSILFVIILWHFLPLKVFSQINPVLMQKQTQENPEQAKEKLARSYFQAQEYDKALELYAQLYESRPQQYYYNYYLNCLVFLNELKEAEKLVKTQSKISPSGFRYIIDEAWISKLSGNDKKAGKLIYELLTNLPQESSQVIQIANALQSRGFSASAIEVYQKARQAEGNEYVYNLELANIYQFSGDYEKMYDAYLEFLGNNPQDMQRIKSQMQSMLRLDVDNNLSDLLKKKLLEKAQSEPDQLVYSQMLIWHSMQTKDFQMAFRQARAIDMRYNDMEIDILEVANVALANGDYETSLKAFEYLKNKSIDSPYYSESSTGYFMALLAKTEANIGSGKSEYLELQKTGLKILEELGLNNQTVRVALKLANIEAFKLAEFDQATLLLENTLQIANLNQSDRAELKLELADILLATDKIWDASLLYAQVEGDLKDEPLGHEAKFRNARLFYFAGEYSWSQTRLDVLKSATSKLIANDAIELSLFIKDVFEEDTTGQVLVQFGKADLLDYQGNYDSSLVLLSNIENEVVGNNTKQYILYKKAYLFSEKQNFIQADSLYSYLVSRFPESIKADNAVFNRAELQRTRLNNTDLAMELYLFLMTNYPESIYANESRVQYRALRKE